MIIFLLTFNTLHDFIIEHEDTHQCNIKEYSIEFDKPINNDINDICNIHHIFHTPFLLNTTQLKFILQKLSKKITTTQKKYTFTYKTKLIKPPKQA